MSASGILPYYVTCKRAVKTPEKVIGYRVSRTEDKVPMRDFLCRKGNWRKALAAANALRDQLNASAAKGVVQEADAKRMGNERGIAV